MDGDDAGKASTLIAHLRTLPPDHVWTFLDRLPRADLAALWPHVPQDCRCPLSYIACPWHAEECDCPAIPAPCVHVLDARKRDWPLPDAAVQYLLEAAAPRDYAQPRPPARSSTNTNPRAQVAIMAERHRRKQQLWHPLDWCRDLQLIDERLTRLLGRGRNGADITGPLLLEGTEASE